MKKVSFASSKEGDYHYRQLLGLVKEHLSSSTPENLVVPRVRAFMIVAAYISCYLLALSQWGNLLVFYSLYAMMGILVVLLYLNVIHEAIHGTLFTREWLNNAFVHVLDLIGANSYVFKKRHVCLHHNFPNVEGWDSDIEQAAFIKITPHGEAKPMHHVQHFTFCLLYPFYLVNWVFVRDFRDFFSATRVVRKLVRKIPAIEYVKLFVFKATFIGYMFVIPVILGMKWNYALAGLFCMLMVGGLFALLVLLTPHVNFTNTFPLPEENDKIEGGWFMHQLNTTNDISSHNWVTENIMGNFNYHLAHHLFPHIAYVHAPEVTKIIADYAKRHKLNYRSYPLGKALVYHYELLKRNASPDELFEDDM